MGGKEKLSSLPLQRAGAVCPPLTDLCEVDCGTQIAFSVSVYLSLVLFLFYREGN